LVLDLLRESGRGERILDIGSGTGALAAELHRFFPRAEIVGIELSREGVERSRIAVPSATFVQRDLVRADDHRPPPSPPRSRAPSSAASSATPREVWLFTVPTEIPSVTAVSRSLSP